MINRLQKGTYGRYFVWTLAPGAERPAPGGPECTQLKLYVSAVFLQGSDFTQPGEFCHERNKIFCQRWFVDILLYIQFMIEYYYRTAQFYSLQHLV